MVLDTSSSIEELSEFYEGSYSASGEDAKLGGAWRDFSGVLKARNVLALGGELPATARCLDVGCGEGAVIGHLQGLRPGWTFAGVEIADRPVELAAAAFPGAEIRRFDGTNLPFADDSFDIAFASHVIEHVPEPVPLLREMARVARRVVIEVPLEDNRSARRPSRRAIAAKVGHVQVLSRESMKALLQEAGLRVVGERSDPLPRKVHLFFAKTPKARAVGTAKWLSRAVPHRLHARTAERLFTVHYVVAGDRAD